MTDVAGEAMSDWIGEFSDSRIGSTSEDDDVAVGVDGMSTTWDEIRLSPLRHDDCVPSTNVDAKETRATSAASPVITEVAADLSYIRDKMYDIRHSHVQDNRSLARKLAKLRQDLRSLDEVNRAMRHEVGVFVTKRGTTRNTVILTVFATCVVSLLFVNISQAFSDTQPLRYGVH